MTSDSCLDEVDFRSCCHKCHFRAISFVSTIEIGWNCLALQCIRVIYAEDIKFRSSRSQMFFKIGVFLKFRKFHRKTPVLESLFNEIDSFTFISKKILWQIFLFLCHILSFGSSGLNWEFICRDYGFSTNLKILFMSSGDKPVLTFKISVTNLCNFNNLQILILKLYFQVKIVSSE